MKYISLLLSLFILSAGASAEMRTWTASNGKTFVGELVSESGGTVTLKGENGKIVKVPIAGLSREDQAYVAFNRPIDLEIDISKSSTKMDDIDCPRISIRKRGGPEIAKSLDLYVMVFDADGRMLNRGRKPDIKIPTPENRLEVTLNDVTFPASLYGETLVIIADAAGKIVAANATGKMHEDKEYQQRILNEELLISYLQSNADNQLGSSLEGKSYKLFKNPFLKTDINPRNPKEFTKEKVSYKTLIQKLTRFVWNGCQPPDLDSYECGTVPFSASTFTFLPSSNYLLDKHFGSITDPEPTPFILLLPWIYHFRGVIEAPQDLTFRLVGQTEAFFYADINGGRMVSSGELELPPSPSAESSFLFPDDKMTMYFGQWITMKKGQQAEINVILGPNEDASYSGTLFIEIEGVDYPQTTGGTPILPLFSTKPLPKKLINSLYADICPYGTEPPDPVVFTVVSDN